MAGMFRTVRLLNSQANGTKNMITPRGGKKNHLIPLTHPAVMVRMASSTPKRPRSCPALSSARMITIGCRPDSLPGMRGWNTPAFMQSGDAKTFFAKLEFKPVTFKTVEVVSGDDDDTLPSPIPPRQASREASA